MGSLSSSLDDSIGLGTLQLTSKTVQEERSKDDEAHPCKKTLSITDLPDECLGLVYHSLKYGTDYSSFGLVCRHWLHIQNYNHESLLVNIDLHTYRLCQTPKISSESFSIILCRLLIRFQHIRFLSLSRLPDVTDYIASQSQFFGSEVQFLSLKGFYEYSDKKLSLIFSPFPRLTSVCLSSSHITDKGLEILAKSYASLQKVDLRDCRKITDRGLEVLAKNCASLKEVDLGECQRISDRGLKVLAKCCASLEKIDLRYCCRITDHGLEGLAKYCASLKKVVLAGCQGITDKSLEALAKCCASLQKVDLGHCQRISGQGLEVLTKRCVSLEKVDLNGCKWITDSEISSLLKNCSKLHSLGISFCSNVTGIGFHGCPKTLTTVEALNTYNLTTEGIKEIASVGGIQYLSLMGDAVNDEAVITISKGCPLLKSLWLECVDEVHLEGWKAIDLLPEDHKRQQKN
ncbi:hypothetical protein MKW98_020685 [Papaver atlanticum]|uniref:F-box/LRR-repeat protein 15-like leucin rich repeat domain-containing protein n=1 Tax=Papaver atlanticum TaxID=357466 RepID=A0AAD4XY21_9MAGN|nr:hypothetical protein MKW98_020685 [Papaver atlanticum]